MNLITNTYGSAALFPAEHNGAQRVLLVGRTWCGNKGRRAHPSGLRAAKLASEALPMGFLKKWGWACGIDRESIDLKASCFMHQDYLPSPCSSLWFLWAPTAAALVCSLCGPLSLLLTSVQGCYSTFMAAVSPSSEPAGAISTWCYRISWESPF